jgi:gas vesicle protein
MSNDEQQGNGFWFGLAIGGLLGAVGSYLSTTDKEQRKKLLAKGKQILEGLEDFGEEVWEKGGEIKKSVAVTAKKTKKTVGEVKPQIEETVGETSEEIEEIARQAIEKIAATTQKAKSSKGLGRFFSKGGKTLTPKK